MKIKLANNETFTVERDQTTVDVMDITNKQATLVSGTNIKTINNESILGSGNITITGGGGTFTEEDPIFTASAAASITSTDITNWNAAEANVQSDWNATSGDAQILNKPTNVSDFTNDAGYLTSFTEVDPVFTASVAAGITSSDISNWNGKTSNVGTVTGIKMNNDSAISPNSSGVVDLGTIITSETTLTKGTTTGSGNAVTDISVNGHQITLAKDTTFLTSHQSLKTINNTAITGSGNITINELPSVTSSDNGKVLMVVNGAWTLVTPAQIYSGSGTPSNAQGNNGDIYLQV